MKFLPFLVILIVLFTGCANDNPRVGQYGSGDDSAYLKAHRNRRDAQISDSELSQHRRQRQDVSEEEDLDQKKRDGTYHGMQQATDFARNFIHF